MSYRYSGRERAPSSLLPLKTRSIFSASIGMHILQNWMRAQRSRMKVSKKRLMS